MTTTGRVLGVDLGGRRIGLALSDPSRTLASPHDVVMRGRDRKTDCENLIAAARAAGATTIVVGLPLSLSGRIGPAARSTLEEVEALRVAALAFGVDVVAHDERFTTVTAERSLQEARMRRDARKRVVDKVAAAVMLQSWLDREAASGQEHA